MFFLSLFTAAAAAVVAPTESGPLRIGTSQTRSDIGAYRSRQSTFCASPETVFRFVANRRRRPAGQTRITCPVSILRCVKNRASRAMSPRPEMPSDPRASEQNSPFNRSSLLYHFYAGIRVVFVARYQNTRHAPRDTTSGRARGIGPRGINVRLVSQMRR